MRRGHDVARRRQPGGVHSGRGRGAWPPGHATAGDGGGAAAVGDVVWAGPPAPPAGSHLCRAPRRGRNGSGAREAVCRLKEACRQSGYGPQRSHGRAEPPASARVLPEIRPYVLPVAALHPLLWPEKVPLPSPFTPEGRPRGGGPSARRGRRMAFKPGQLCLSGRPCGPCHLLWPLSRTAGDGGARPRDAALPGGLNESSAIYQGAMAGDGLLHGHHRHHN
mmetsp:Transcript_31751/g.90170  ORF Transcript_31751/g.90170 Transcript_31751/m.90170 type:complete len:221 (+) Transcript_31751:6012-6674(+)